MGIPRTYRWSLRSVSGMPSARKAACMAYDSARNLALFFGGGGLDDTWIWNGARWTEIRAARTPPARSSACMAYDSTHAQIILFGGVAPDGHLLADTWAWNGVGWTQLSSSNSPPARCGACMAYDPTHKRIVLFGGLTYGERVGKLLNDTWTWDGTRWTRQQAEALPARTGACMTWDETQHYTLLFGGTSGDSTFADTWTWDGAHWSKHQPQNIPPARAWSSLVYHSLQQSSILISGGGEGTPSDPTSLMLSDTWSWDGNNWQEVAANAPHTSYHSATYDATRQNIIVYSTNGDKTELSGRTQQERAFISATARLNSETWLWEPSL